MAEKMLVSEALDERDFLKKKITDAIKKLEICAVKKSGDEKYPTGETREEYEKRAAADYQSVNDLIKRYNDLNVKIVESNAKEMIKTKSGVEMTRAEAIARRKVIVSNENENFECMLIKKLSVEYSDMVRDTDRMRQRLEDKQESYKQAILSKEKEISENELAAVQTLSKGDEPDVTDVIDVKKEIDTKTEAYNKFVSELDTAIKVSNATTYIEL